MCLFHVLVDLCRPKWFGLFLLQETVAASVTDMERNNLRRAMYSREAVRTEEDEEGERSWDTASAVSGHQTAWLHTERITVHALLISVWSWNARVCLLVMI